MKFLIVGRNKTWNQYLADLLEQKGFAKAQSAAKEQLEHCDFCIARPGELKALLSEMSDTSFTVVHMAVPGNLKGMDPEEILEDKDGEFALFESVPLNSEDHPFLSRPLQLMEIRDCSVPKELKHYVNIIQNEWTLHYNLIKIVQRCKTAGILNAGEQDPEKIILYYKDRDPEELSCEIFASVIRNDMEGLALVMLQYLSLEVYR